MTDDLELQAKSIFGEIVQQALSPDETQVYLDEACGENNELKQRIQILLDAYTQSHHLLDIPSGERAAAAHEIPGEKYTTVLDLPPFPDSNLGKSIGPYKLIERLGEGGMGIVYLAQQHQPIRRKVALKVIKPGMDSRQVLARFEAERHALALMDHPHIARVLDGGVSESGQPYFVMEYVKGLPITKYCDQMQMTVPERLKLFHQVCHAVQHAHQKGIIHRDLKPSNILICLYDGKPVPKVIDFGLAKALYQPLGIESVHTAHGLMVGTPRYMSPEQAELNNLDIDTRSDIYSLGVVLYELLTGSTPIEREHLKTVADREILRLIREYDPPRPSQRISSSSNSASISAQRHVEPRQLSRLVRGELDWIVMRALDKERHRRYETANGLARDIERYLADEPVEACPPSMSYRISKFVRRNRGRVAMAAATLAGLLLMTVVFAWQGHLIRLERNATRMERDKARIAEALATNERDLALAARAEADIAAEAERVAKQLAESRENETQMILDFVLDKVMAATRPKGQSGGVKFDITLLEAIREATGQIATSFQGQPLIEARIRMSLGQSFYLMGEYESAAGQFKTAYELRRQHLGETSVEAIDSYGDLANALADSGQLQEALEMRTKVVEWTRSLYDENHRAMLRAKNNLGHSLLETGNVREAVPLFEDLLSIYEANLGERDLSFIRAMHNLAQSYYQLGRHDEAIALAKRALALWDTTVGLDHPDAIATSRTLIYCYIALGWYDEALKIAVKNVPLCRQTFGNTHPATLHSMSNLAQCYQRLGYFEEAIKLQEETLALWQQSMGKHHPNTLKFQQNMALSLQSLNRHTAALNLANETLLLMQTHLGNAHPDTLITLETVANGLSDLGRREEAREQYQQLIKLARESLGNEHTITLSNMLNLAMEYAASNQRDHAVELLEEALEQQQSALGVNHPLTQMTIRSLGNVQRQLKAENELNEFRAAVDEIEAQLGASNLKTIEARDKLAARLLSSGRAAEAVEVYSLALEQSQQSLGESAETTIDIMHGMAHGYLSLGQIERSVSLHEEVYEKSRLLFGDESPNTLSAQSCLALGYFKQGKVQQGIDLLTRGYDQTANDPRFQKVAMQLVDAHVEAGLASAAAKYAPKAADYIRSRPDLSPAIRAQSLERIGVVLFESGDHKEAIKFLAEALTILETNFPGSWNTFAVQAKLGLTFLNEGNFDQAESQLTSGMIGMKRTRKSQPEMTDQLVREAIAGLIELNTQLDRPAEVARWKSEYDSNDLTSNRDSETIPN